MIMSPGSGHRVQKQKYLVSLDKELKDGHRGDLSRSRFINAKQSKSREKVHSPHGMVCSLMKECCARGPKT
jgi:hypothetical protein